MVTTLAVTAKRAASASTTMAMKATSQFGSARAGHVPGPEDPVRRPRIERMASTGVSLAASGAVRTTQCPGSWAAMTAERENSATKRGQVFPADPIGSPGCRPVVPPIVLCCPLLSSVVLCCPHIVPIIPVILRCPPLSFIIIRCHPLFPIPVIPELGRRCRASSAKVPALAWRSPSGRGAPSCVQVAGPEDPPAWLRRCARDGRRWARHDGRLRRWPRRPRRARWPR